jgi:hypothetical protein
VREEHSYPEASLTVTTGGILSILSIQVEYVVLFHATSDTITVNVPVSGTS